MVGSPHSATANGQENFSDSKATVIYCSVLQARGMEAVNERSFRMLMKYSNFGFSGILVAISFAALPAFSQKISGDIVGVVYETSGAVIPGAAVTLKNLDTSRELNTVSSGDGSYSFP